ncbi:MAG TPA: hypothetical protein PKV71_06855 [Calditrichia bacterium]|nr:hypothetical protein [Calditrichia bacterium]
MYQPINCGFHDRLESLAILKKTVGITFRDGASNRTVTGIIHDVFARGKEEFISIDGKMLIRLDHIVGLEEL